MSPPRGVSVGQMAANAIAEWLRASIDSDIRVSARWPDPDVKLPAKAVTVLKVGKRSRLDVVADAWVQARTDVSPTQAEIAFGIGAFIQPMQVDVWAENDIARDDMVAQIDDAFVKSLAETLGPGFTGAPVRDGILLRLEASDNNLGFVDCWFDEPTFIDSPDAVARSEYRATYAGEARGVLTATRAVPRLVASKARVLAYQGRAPAPGQLSSVTTLSPNPGTPPPTVIVLRSIS